MFERFSEKAREAVMVADEEAKRRGDDPIEVRHFFVALSVVDGGARAKLDRAGLTEAVIRSELEMLPGQKFGGEVTHVSRGTRFSAEAKLMLEQGLRVAMQSSSNMIETDHLLAALIQLAASEQTESKPLEPPALRDLLERADQAELAETEETSKETPQPRKEPASPLTAEERCELLEEKLKDLEGRVRELEADRDSRLKG